MFLYVLECYDYFMTIWQAYTRIHAESRRSGIVRTACRTENAYFVRPSAKTRRRPNHSARNSPKLPESRARRNAATKAIPIFDIELAFDTLTMVIGTSHNT